MQTPLTTDPPPDLPRGRRRPRGREVVVVGEGAICGLGADAAAIWAALCAGRSAVGPVRQWDLPGRAEQLAAEIADYDANSLVADRKTLKLVRRSHVLGLHAGAAAIAAAGFLAQRSVAGDAAAFNDASGIFVGAGGGAFQDQYDYLPLLAVAQGDLRRFGRELAHAVNPMWLLQTLPNNVLCHLGIQSGFTGAHACIVNHSISGVQALGEALEALRDGTVARAVAVAHQAPIEPQTLEGFAALGLLSSDTVRPFDRGRDGCLLGEGGAALALEPADAARARGANVLGRLRGSAAVTEGEGLFEVRADGDGLVRAIDLALTDAECAAADIGLIVAHGNGTRASDASEAAALRSLFGDGMPPVTSFKWATGHLLAAAGLLDTLLALAALRDRVVPGIATLREPDPACALPVSCRAQEPRGDLALVLSRGFAGTNAAVVVER
jgi:3-oxoacyl-[acyl-carrier-protein] synthase I